MAYQLLTGDEPLSSVIERIIDASCAAAPGLDAGRCREIVELMFRARVHQTESCSRHDECRPVGPLWGRTSVGDGTQRSVGWSDLDPDALPDIYASAVVDLLDPSSAGDRRDITAAVAASFRAILTPLLHENPRCGRSAICRAEPTFPLTSDSRRRVPG